MKPDIMDASLENCIYCGACFKYCVLNAYNELDGFRGGKDGQIKELLDRCTLQGYCDKVCPSMVKPYIRNQIAKKKIMEGK
jgi:Fe-S oxidoreductase